MKKVSVKVQADHLQRLCSVQRPLVAIEELTQVRDFAADFQNFGSGIERKSFAGGARVRERRCSEDLPR